MYRSRVHLVLGVGLFILGMLATTLVSATPGDPLDSTPVRAPSTPPSGQRQGVSARNADGDSVVVWQDSVPSDSDASVINHVLFGRTFQADGTPNGAQFTLADAGQDFIGTARVAMADDGRFAVVWVLSDRDDEGRQVMLRRFDADGAPLGPSTVVKRVRSRLASISPDIAMAADGRFVVLWARSYDPILGRTLVKARRYGADGMPSGRAMRVAGRLSLDLGLPLGNPLDFPPRIAVSTLIDPTPDVAMADNGDFVVAWAARTSAGITQVDEPLVFTIYARRFRDDALLPGARQVIQRLRYDNGTFGFRPDLDVADPQVAIIPDGSEYVVSWRDPATADQRASLVFRRMGGGSGAVVPIVAGGDDLGAPKLDISDDGQLAFAWMRFPGDTVLAAVYGANDEVATPAFPVSADHIARGVGSVSSAANGDFLVTFDDTDGDDDILADSVYIRRYSGQ